MGDLLSGDIGDLGEGNTSATPKSKNRDVQRKFWCFTFFYFVEDVRFLSLLVRLEISFKRGIFGFENCPTTNRKHVQGFGVSSNSKGNRFSQLHKLYPDIHFEPCNGSEEQNLVYCQKSGSSRKFGYPHPVETITVLRVWQEQLLSKLSLPADGRSIFWVWEPDGNIGKSSFCKYMLVHHKATYIDQGKKADIINHIYNTDMDKIKIVFIDCPRNTGNKISYSACESILNGMIFNSKYETGMKLFNPVNICVFSNFPPERSMMSNDRWRIFEIRDNGLI